MIFNKDKKNLITKYIELIDSKRINPLIINIEIYNILEYLPYKERIKNSIKFNIDNELEYWMWLASPLLFDFIKQYEKD